MATSILQVYRDSMTLKLAAEISDFVRSKTEDIKNEDHRLTICAAALGAAQATFSFREWPEDQ